jgi:hypothetical protein
MANGGRSFLRMSSRASLQSQENLSTFGTVRNAIPFLGQTTPKRCFAAWPARTETTEGDNIVKMEELEKLAMKGEPMPGGLSMPDQLLFLCLRDL